MPPRHTDLPIAKLRCPKCDSWLDVRETTSGARIIGVAVLGPSVEDQAQALEAVLSDLGLQRVCERALPTYSAET